MTVHADGRRTLRAVSEIDDPPPVLRDVIYSVEPDYHPKDAFVRLTVGDQFMGSGWFNFASGFAECESFTIGEGRVSNSDDFSGRLRGLTCHPIQGDAWLTGCYDLSKGPGVQLFPKTFMTSADHRGATGPMLVRGSSGLEFVGEKTIKVAAGRFQAYHFRFVKTANNHPPYNLWTSTDGNYVFLRGEVDGYMKTAYELASLETL